MIGGERKKPAWRKAIMTSWKENVLGPADLPLGGGSLNCPELGVSERVPVLTEGEVSDPPPHPHPFGLLLPSPPIWTKPGPSTTPHSVLTFRPCLGEVGRRDSFHLFSSRSMISFPNMFSERGRETEAGGPSAEDRAQWVYFPQAQRPPGKGLPLTRLKASAEERGGFYGL